MAAIRWGDLIGPIGVGVASSVGQIVQSNAIQRGTGPEMMKQAALWTDVLIGGYAVANYTMDLGFPRTGSAETLGAGIALLTRRASDFVARNLLRLEGGRYTPARGRIPALRGRPAFTPGAAVETSVLPRKRQFFSVT